MQVEDMADQAFVSSVFVKFVMSKVDEELLDIVSISCLNVSNCEDRKLGLNV